MNFLKNDNVFYYESGNLNLKIASFDLDHTLIRPKNGRIHPKDKGDLKRCFSNVKEKLSELNDNGYRVVIFTNQSSFEKVDKKTTILSRIKTFIKMMEIPIDVYISVKGDYCRKPNTGMWDMFLGDLDIDVANSFYVGDAAGRIGWKQNKDFSYSGRMFAKNIGIKFFTPEKYFQPSVYKNREIYILPKKWITFEKKQPPLDIEDYEVIILIGPPGSGKSTIANSLPEFTLISQDILKTKSKCIKHMNTALKNGERVLVDNTNPKRDKRKDYIDIAKTYNKKVLAVVINITKEQSMFLVNYRCKKNKNIRVPDVAIHIYYKNFEKPIKGEGFDKIVERTFVPNLSQNDKKLFQQYF